MEKQKQNEQNRINLPVKVNLTIEVYDKNGNLKKRIEKQNDPPVENFILCMLGTSYYGDIWLTLPDGFSVRINFPAQFGICERIQIGTGQVPFDWKQYRLANLYAETTNITKSLWREIGQGYEFDAVANFNITENVTIYETGLIGFVYYAGRTYHFLVARDYFEYGIELFTGDVLIVKYTFVFGII